VVLTSAFLRELAPWAVDVRGDDRPEGYLYVLSFLYVFSLI
jgi:hypothetical protein